MRLLKYLSAALIAIGLSVAAISPSIATPTEAPFTQQAFDAS